jgi:lipid-A-disaccharide synthase
MRYYLIVGEASGDLHASRLMHALNEEDAAAEFRFFGGDLMAAEGGTRVRHYKDLAYMGFIPVLLHLRTIFRNMAFCKQDIVAWKPDVVILVDYPGFNLDIAKFVHAKTSIPVYYYISPKIWAWKEWRIKNIKRDVSEMFSILPFEVPFYEQKHHFPIHYVGNPTAEEVRTFLAGYHETKEEFCRRNNLDLAKPIIALLAGSRKQEIKDNLPAMIESTDLTPRPLPVPSPESPSPAPPQRGGKDMLQEYPWAEYQLVIAGAPSIDRSFYEPFLSGASVKLVFGETYPLLAHATAALVTSGTATLETALFNVPQVVCYETPVPKIIRWGFNHIIQCKYISLVNLIADEEVVPELFADRFSVDNIRRHLLAILPGQPGREKMLEGYRIVRERLGNDSAPENAAKIMVATLQKGE